MDPLFVLGWAAAVSGLYFAASRRRGSVERTHIGVRRIELASPGEPADVFARIAAIGHPYRVDDQDATKLVLVLSSRPSIWSYGFLYPVVVRAREGGGSTIAIGVTSRLIHVGPGVGIAHDRCARAIASLLSVPEARIT